MQEKIISTTEHLYTAVFEPVVMGGFQVTVPIMPGLVTYGRSFEEAQEMARDAIVCYIEGLKKDNEEIPHESGLIHEQIMVSV
ncbi:MAG: type II toxin-antitoxin system HicB family antitoxin [Patescibacteria group bacterium]